MEYNIPAKHVGIVMSSDSGQRQFKQNVPMTTKHQNLKDVQIAMRSNSLQRHHKPILN